MMNYVESLVLSYVANPIGEYCNYMFSPLCYAAQIGNLPQLKLLLEQPNANINERSVDLGESIIEIASRFGHEEVISYLLTTYGTSISKDDICKAFVLSITCKSSTQRSYHILLNYCILNNISHPDLLETLCAKGSFELLKTFYSICMKTNVVVDVDELLVTALSHSKNKIAFWLLEECYANPVCLEEVLRPPSNSLTKDEEDTLVMLISYGLPLDRIKFDLTPRLSETHAVYLKFAEKSEQILKAASAGDVTKILELAKDPELQERINHCRTDTRNTPLALAAFEGHLEAVKALLDNFNCDINCTNDHNATPLIMAVQGKRPAVVQELLKRGANKDIQTGRKSVYPGRTALNIAKHKEQMSSAFQQIIALMLEGAEVELHPTTEEEQTPPDSSNINSEV